MARFDLRLLLFLFLGALAIKATWLMAFFFAPVDANQGIVYRIIFLHVPAAMTAFASAAGLAVASIIGLTKDSQKAMAWSRALAEIGFVFTLLTLATGSIWGRPTWGVWWTWDARLTTTLLLAILYAGYLLLYTSMTPGPSRTKACAILGILICVDVPIIYKSVTWWRTLHQPPSMLREGGSTMHPDILSTLVTCIVVMLVFAAIATRERARNLLLRDELESLTYDQFSSRS